MAITYPTNLDSLTNPSSTDTLDSPSHSDQHSDLNDAVEALETKVGIDSSTTATTIDYKLTNSSSSNPGHKHTLANGATDVTASKDEVNVLDGITASTAELNKTEGIGGDIVGTSDTQTLTNKTFNVGDNTVSGTLRTQVYKSAVQAVADSSWVAITFDLEDFDSGGLHDISTNNSRITIPTGGGGVYLFAGTVGLATAFSADRVIVSLYKNGSVEQELVDFTFTCGADGQFTIGTHLLELVATDYIELKVYQVTGGSVNLSVQTRFSAIKLL
jgi:hypothetical protein